MAGRMKGASWRAAVLAIAAIGVVTLGGTAFAGHIESGVKSYTGCLVPKDGVIIKVKEGNAPASPCTGGQTQVHLSGGDITRISGGPGVTVDPESSTTQNGHVTIDLDPKYALPQGCEEGEVAKWDDGDEAWACALDNDTRYSAGTGLDLDGSSNTTFEIESAYRLPGKVCTTAGQFARGFDSNGTIRCEPLPSSAISVYAARQASGIGIPSNQVLTDVLTLPEVPAGTYSINAIGNGSQTDQREWSMQCYLRTGSSVLSSTGLNVGEDQPGGGIHFGFSMAMASVATFTGTTTLKVACTSLDDGVGAEQFTIQAIKFG